MALTTSITPAIVSVALGRPAPASGSTAEAQLELWISDALRFVQRRVTQLGVEESSIDSDDLDYIIREAVVALARKPDESTQVAVTTDDTTVSKSFRPGTGRIEILGEWWELLGLAATKGKAYSVDLMPPGAGIGGDRETYWWVTP